MVFIQLYENMSRHVRCRLILDLKQNLQNSQMNQLLTNILCKFHLVFSHWQRLGSFGLLSLAEIREKIQSKRYNNSDGDVTLLKTEALFTRNICS